MTTGTFGLLWDKCALSMQFEEHQYRAYDNFIDISAVSPSCQGHSTATPTWAHLRFSQSQVWSSIGMPSSMRRWRERCSGSPG